MPAGVTSAVFNVYGAAGGDLTTTAGSAVIGGSGGKGGRVQGTVAVAPGQTLYMRVGGVGEAGAAFAFGDSATGTVAGGFNGGGSNSETCAFCSVEVGGAGGGASDVRDADDGLADRLLVAGGGGGAGVGSVDSTVVSPGDGGNSATAAPALTSEFDGVLTSCSGGGAGTLLGPGAAGSGTRCVSGSSGAGADGGGSVAEHNLGAGGGGYFGGGAGAVGSFLGSGGGGGSDYPDPNNLPAGTSNVTVTDGVQSGNGLITVSYSTASALAATLVSDSTGKAPGTALGDKATAIQTAVNANPAQTAIACADITNYLGLVKAQSSKKVSPANAPLLTTDATNLAAALGC